MLCMLTSPCQDGGPGGLWPLQVEQGGRPLQQFTTDSQAERDSWLAALQAGQHSNLRRQLQALQQRVATARGADTNVSFSI